MPTWGGSSRARAPAETVEPGSPRRPRRGCDLEPCAALDGAFVGLAVCDRLGHHRFYRGSGPRTCVGWTRSYRALAPRDVECQLPRAHVRQASVPERRPEREHCLVERRQLRRLLAQFALRVSCLGAPRLRPWPTRSFSWRASSLRGTRMGVSRQASDSGLAGPARRAVSFHTHTHANRERTRVLKRELSERRQLTTATCCRNPASEGRWLHGWSARDAHVSRVPRRRGSRPNRARAR